MKKHDNEISEIIFNLAPKLAQEIVLEMSEMVKNKYSPEAEKKRKQILKELKAISSKMSKKNKGKNFPTSTEIIRQFRNGGIE